MPDWVQSDELWERAKERALHTYKRNQPEFWAAVTEIYKRMGGKIKSNLTSAVADLVASVRNRRARVEEVIKAVKIKEHTSHSRSGTVFTVKEHEDIRNAHIQKVQSSRTGHGQRAHRASWQAFREGTPAAHRKAAKLHGQAADYYADKMERPGDHMDELAMEHADYELSHEQYARTGGTRVAGVAKATEADKLEDLVQATRIKEHTRVSKTGKVSTVKEHEDKRQKLLEKHNVYLGTHGTGGASPKKAWTEIGEGHSTVNMYHRHQDRSALLLTTRGQGEHTWHVHNKEAGYKAHGVERTQELAQAAAEEHAAKHLHELANMHPVEEEWQEHKRRLPAATGEAYDDFTEGHKRAKAALEASKKASDSKTHEAAQQAHLHAAHQWEAMEDTGGFEKHSKNLKKAAAWHRELAEHHAHQSKPFEQRFKEGVKKHGELPWSEEHQSLADQLSEGAFNEDGRPVSQAEVDQAMGNDYYEDAMGHASKVMGHRWESTSETGQAQDDEQMKATDRLLEPIRKRIRKVANEGLAEYKQIAKQDLDASAPRDPADRIVRASDPADVIRCRTSVGTHVRASKPWAQDESVEFIYAPEGQHTITAGFRKNETITISVVVDELTANDLQESFGHLTSSMPKQEPYGDEDHESKKATIRFPVAATSFRWGEIKGEKGVIISGGEPTSYGADAVNGKTYRSWSPEFTTDADFARAKKNEDNHWTFPDGVRGSESNPARLVGVNFVVGALTNRPAFRAMPPVRAKQADTVQAARVLNPSCELAALAANIQLAHWAADTKTNEHEALGMLYASMAELVDTFAESYSGKTGSLPTGSAQVQVETNLSALMDRGLQTVNQIKSGMKAGKDDDLINLLADMEGAIHKTRYLLKASEPADDGNGAVQASTVRQHQSHRGGKAFTVQQHERKGKHAIHTLSSWQVDPDSLKTEHVQVWGDTMMGRRTLEEAKQAVRNKTHFVISEQAIGTMAHHHVQWPFNPQEAAGQAKVAGEQPTPEEKVAALEYSNNWSWTAPVPPHDYPSDHASFIKWVDEHGKWIKLSGSDESMNDKSIQAAHIKEHMSTSKTGKVFSVKEHMDSRKAKQAKAEALTNKADELSRKAVQHTQAVMKSPVPFPSDHTKGDRLHNEAAHAHKQAEEAWREVGDEGMGRGHSQAYDEHQAFSEAHNALANLVRDESDPSHPGAASNYANARGSDADFDPSAGQHLLAYALHTSAGILHENHQAGSAEQAMHHEKKAAKHLKDYEYHMQDYPMLEYHSKQAGGSGPTKASDPDRTNGAEVMAQLPPPPQTSERILAQLSQAGAPR